MKRPIPDTVVIRRCHLRIDESFYDVARDHNVIPKIAAYVGRRPERMKSVYILVRPGPKYECSGAPSARSGVPSGS
jgi:hypothetical protein